MADEPTPPISTDVPETVSTDLRVDKDTQQALNADFQDFWAEQDSKEALSKEPAAPEAPGEGALQETKESKAIPEAEARSKTESEPELPKEKEYSDEDIDKLALTDDHPRTQAIEDFKQIKHLWKQDRARLRAEANKAAKLEAELNEARRSAWTPEQKADYEHAAAIRRKFDVASDPEFVQRFHQPIRSTFENVLEEAVSVLPDRDAARQWADDIKQNYPPDQLNRSWWLNSVVAKVPNELDRTQLLNSVTDLLKLQKERDSELTRRTSDKSAYDRWIEERDQIARQRIQDDIMSEINVQEKRIAEVLPRDPETAKTNEERQAIEKHNERFQKLNKFFQDTVQDLSKNGPKAWVRASVEATRSLLLETQNKELESELKGLKKELDQYKSELEKIQGARRRISHTSGTPPTPAGKKIDGNNSLSIKDLDIRKSFDAYDWGDR
jgi:hypothetical protein